MKEIKLERSLGLVEMVFYGLGTIIGAGIYVLMGKVAGVSGIYFPISFLCAGVIAVFTAFSYSELSSRFPRNSGASLYVGKAWNRKYLSRIVGYGVVFTAVVSAATITHGFVGYVKVFLDLPEIWLMISVIILLGFMAVWGIKESSMLIVTVTLIEVGGLLFIIFIGFSGEGVLELTEQKMVFDLIPWSEVFLGSFLAFFAFIGFEDMVNLVEEVKNPKRNMPLAIIISIILSSILYLLVSLAALNSLPVSELAGSDSPISDIVEAHGYSPNFMVIVSLIAIINGVLVQMIVASRILYGMAQQKIAHRIFSRVNSYTKTPVIATLLVLLLIILFSICLPIVTLAKTTSFLILCIFTVVNLALVFVKLKIKLEKSKDEVGVNYHILVPIVGAILCFMILLFQVFYV
jgi:APA family basic amino acid/polyamine antiporter